MHLRTEVCAKGVNALISGKLTSEYVREVPMSCSPQGARFFRCRRLAVLHIPHFPRYRLKSYSYTSSTHCFCRRALVISQGSKSKRHFDLILGFTTIEVI